MMRVSAPRSSLGLLLLMMVGCVSTVGETRPSPVAPSVDAPPVAFAVVQEVIGRRCTACHHAAGAEDVKLDTPAGILAARQVILWNAVENHYMPPGNLTGMTVEERELVGRWIRQGASPK